MNDLQGEAWDNYMQSESIKKANEAKKQAIKAELDLCMEIYLYINYLTVS